MKPILRLACILLLAAALAGSALADAAPPLQPPGSNLAPGGETQVQMVAETVTLEVVAPAAVHVAADFTMRNQGPAEERMAVRFPLEEPTGMGNGYNEFPQVQNVTVAVDGASVPWQTMVEPFREGDAPIHWAAFDVAFPPAQDVRLLVTYETELSGYPAGSGWASVHYILETGAGWQGPIGAADIILRLPYEAGPENVLGEPYTVPGASYASNEARWHRENLEPAREDNMRVGLVWPEAWQQVLAARAALEAQPADVQAAIDLAEAYRLAGSGTKGFVANPLLADQAQSTIEQALAAAPESADLHAELASLLVWRLPYAATPDDPSLPRIRAELASAFALEPQNARALQAQQELVARMGLGAAVEPSPTPSGAVGQATKEAGSPQPQPTGQVEPTATPSPAHSPAPAGGLDATRGWLYFILVPAALVAFVIYLGVRRRR